ncbi:hypothetical protein E2C01_071212 [Portunus trituberculatus]|uniref:Uncharacterized protein n=1 Tax=Portunus trituberculatus TaxID=210409 RepID=A0A5B7HWE0_PORTR|nr:hypothetical protein [Portunus trituberculatus]
MAPENTQCPAILSSYLANTKAVDDGGSGGTTITPDVTEAAFLHTSAMVPEPCDMFLLRMTYL